VSAADLLSVLLPLPQTAGICHRFRDKKDKMVKQEKQEIKQMNKEEGIVELDDDEKDKLIDLDSFTALPRPEDILHYAVHLKPKP
jgi:hypothetical protein